MYGSQLYGLCGTGYRVPAMVASIGQPRNDEAGSGEFAAAFER